MILYPLVHFNITSTVKFFSSTVLRLFLRFSGPTWSVAERKTEKLRRRFEGLTESLQDDMTRDSYSQECRTACSSADSFLLQKSSMQRYRSVFTSSIVPYVPYFFLNVNSFLFFYPSAHCVRIDPKLFGNLRCRFAALKHILDGLQLHFLAVLHFSHCDILSLLR